MAPSLLSSSSSSLSASSSSSFSHIRFGPNASTTSLSDDAPVASRSSHRYGTTHASPSSSISTSNVMTSSIAGAHASSSSSSSSSSPLLVLLPTDPLSRASKSGDWHALSLLLYPRPSPSIVAHTVGSGVIVGLSRHSLFRYVNRRDANGSTALFLASLHGHYRCVVLLIHAGALVNLQNHRRNTAMHAVVERGHYYCARAILAAGGRIDIGNWEGRNCMGGLAAMANATPMQQSMTPSPSTIAVTISSSSSSLSTLAALSPTLATPLNTTTTAELSEYHSYIRRHADHAAREKVLRMDLFGRGLGLTSHGSGADGSGGVAGSMSYAPTTAAYAIQSALTTASVNRHGRLSATSDGSTSATSLASSSMNGVVYNDNESIRRLCWSINHLECDSMEREDAMNNRRMSTNRSSPSSSSSSLPSSSLSSISMIDAHLSVLRHTDDEQYADMDPALVAPIRVINWFDQTHQSLVASQHSARMPMSSGSIMSSSSSPASMRLLSTPLPTPTPSSFVSAPALFVPDPSHITLTRALRHIHALARTYPQSNLGPGLEDSFQPIAQPANDVEAAAARADQQGPTLSAHGLSHFMYHIATHWPGLPLAWKKFFLSYLIRFASNASNARAMLTAQRPILDGWLAHLGSDGLPGGDVASVGVLQHLIDVVLDWLELQRGLSAVEAECSLLPISQMYASVVQSFVNTTTAAMGQTATANENSNVTDGGASNLSISSSSPSFPHLPPSINIFASPRLPSSSPLPFASPSLLSGSTSYARSSSSIQPPALSFSTLASRVANMSNPHALALAGSSYIDDYELASLLVELVASILATINSHRDDDIVESTQNDARSERLRVAVENEELFSGSNPSASVSSLSSSSSSSPAPKICTSSGGRGVGVASTLILPAERVYGSLVREGVLDPSGDRVRAHAQRASDAALVRRIMGARSEPSAKDAENVALWRSIIRMFDSSDHAPASSSSASMPNSSLLRLHCILLRAPFLPSLHPVIPLRLVYLLRESFQILAHVRPALMEKCCRRREQIEYVIHAMANVKNLVKLTGFGEAQRKRGTGANGEDVKDGEGDERWQYHHAQEEEKEGEEQIDDDHNDVDEDGDNNKSVVQLRLLASSSSTSLLRDDSTPSLSASASIDRLSIASASNSSSPPSDRDDVVSYLRQLTASDQSLADATSVSFAPRSMLASRAASAAQRTSQDAFVAQLRLETNEPYAIGASTALALGSGHQRSTSMLRSSSSIAALEMNASKETGMVQHSSSHAIASSSSSSSTVAPLKWNHYSSSSIASSSLSHFTPSINSLAAVAMAAASAHTFASQSKLKLSTKQFVMKQLEEEKQMRRQQRKEKYDEEANTIQRIGEEERGVNTSTSSLSERVDRLRLAPLSVMSPVGVRGGMSSSLLSPPPPSHPPLFPPPFSPLSPISPPPVSYTSVSQYRRAASSLPDYWCATTIAKRLMLTDRCVDFILAIIVDSSSRAASQARKSASAAQKRKVEEDERAREMQIQDQIIGIDAAKSDLMRAVKIVRVHEIIHTSTNNRSLIATNDVYGPPPLTTTCVSLIDWGILDALLMMLSPSNQSISCNPPLPASLSPPLFVLTSEHANIGVLQSVQSLGYLLRMDSCVDLLYNSKHVLHIYTILSTTSSESVAASILYLFSHLLRKRKWNARIQRLKGKSHMTHMTSDEDRAEKAREAERLARGVVSNASIQAARDRGDALDDPESANLASDSDAAAYIPFEFVLMSWSRVAIHLSLTCLPLKPWSTLPASVLARLIPKRPSAIPPRVLVYRAPSALKAAEQYKIRREEDARDRVVDQARRMKRAEENREERAAKERIDAAENDHSTMINQSADTHLSVSLLSPAPPASLFSPLSSLLSPALLASRLAKQASLLTSLLRRANLQPNPELEPDLVGANQPLEASWLARHYTPPNLEQKRYMKAMGEEQKWRIVKAKQAGEDVRKEEEKRIKESSSDSSTSLARSSSSSSSSSSSASSLIDASYSSAPSLPSSPAPLSSFARRARLLVVVARLGGLGSSKKVDIPRLDIADLDQSMDTKGRAWDLYQLSSTRQLGEIADQSSASATSTHPQLRDVNTMVVEQYLFQSPLPLSQSRAIQHMTRETHASIQSSSMSSSLSSSSSSIPPSSSPHHSQRRVDADTLVDSILAPTNRSLQRRLDEAPHNPVRIGRAIEVAPRMVIKTDDSERATISQDASSEGSTNDDTMRSSASGDMLDISQLTTPSSSSPTTNRDITSSTDNNSNDRDLSIDDLQSRIAIVVTPLSPPHVVDPNLLVNHIRRRDGDRINVTISSPTHRPPANPSSSSSFSTPARQSNNHAHAHSTPVPPSRASQSADATSAATPRTFISSPKSTNSTIHADPNRMHDPSYVIGGVSIAPSYSNISMAECLIHRVLQCMYGFTRYQVDATKLLHCGGVEFIVGLINHPTYDISLSALQLLTILTTRFSVDFLVSLMEVLSRSHLSNCWLGMSIGRTAEGEELGFPWADLTSIITSCADFLRVDERVAYEHEHNGNDDSSSSILNDIAIPRTHAPLRDARTPLAFQLLVNLCQDPRGVGYSLVQAAAVWYENLLHDVLTHPSLSDLQRRKKNYAAARCGNAAAHGAAAGEAAGAAKSAFPYARGNGAAKVNNGAVDNAVIKPSSRRASPSRARSASMAFDKGAINQQRSSSKQTNAQLLAVPSSIDISDDNSYLPPHRRHTSVDVTSPPSRLQPSPPPSTSSSSVVPRSPFSASIVTPFGGAWHSSHSMPHDRSYHGGAGLPMFSNIDGASSSSSSSIGGSHLRDIGLDWSIPTSSIVGSTELHDLISSSLLSTQSVHLRICDLSSCSAIESVASSFLLCPRCRQVAYCCVEHRRIAWKSWHDKRCSIVTMKVPKRNQTVRYPVKMRKTLTSGWPMRTKEEMK